MSHTFRREQGFQMLIYFFAFLLLWEWLRPVSMFTDTGNVAIFILYAAFCFFISMLNIKWWIATGLKLFALLAIIDGLFISELMFSPSWFRTLFMHIQYNIEIIGSQEWVYMTPLFRTVLFLILLWLVSYLLHYWFIVAKRVFVFILLTFIYLTVVDTFTNYQADAAIVRTFVIALLTMGAVTIQKEIGNDNQVWGGFRKVSIWLLPLVAIIFLSAAVGFAAPKLSPQWPDPVPYLTSLNSNSGVNGDGPGGTVQRVGYGVNDSRLGGSFIDDTAPVFQALAEDKHYWRIETRDLYTGKGWENSAESEFEFQQNGNISLETFEQDVETEELEAYVSFDADGYFAKAVYPYGVRQLEGSERIAYMLDLTTDAISIEAPEQSRQALNYRVEYENPSFPIDRLEEANEEDPATIRERYLQLPDTLPQRVENLASQVVSGTENRYQAVKTVEQYFNQNGFTYQTKDVAVPGENQDYVDQFLFETKRGYCDNYSTSMVVMLRTLDIPARWVKGFTGGELMLDREAPEGMNYYQVTNSNAHSWVEVYFSGIGWVPFEPTQGFTNPMDFYMETDTEENAQTDTEEEQAQEMEGSPEELEGNQVEEEDTTAAASSDEDNGGNGGKWLLLAAGIIGLMVYLYFFRHRLLSAYFLKKYKKTNDAATYQNAYHYLLKLLEHKGIKRAEGQTLREYAILVDRKFDTNEMSRLTYYYERILYRNDADSTQWGKMTELWENLVKRSLS